MRRHFLFNVIEQSGSGKSPLVGQADDAQIQEWKTKHKNGIYCIEVGGHAVYFKNPNRQEMNCAFSKAEKDATLDMFEELATLTKIGGSDEPLSDDAMFFGLIQVLKDKMDGLKAKLKNL